MIDKDGHIVTNYHVVEGADRDRGRLLEPRHRRRRPSSAPTPPPTSPCSRSTSSAQALTPLPLADSDAVEVGDPVVAIGNPFGLERTVTAGIVSALQRAVTAPNGYTIDHVIQTDAPINSGNSGGPLIDAHGRVIGVNSQIETGGGARRQRRHRVRRPLQHRQDASSRSSSTTAASTAPIVGVTLPRRRRRARPRPPLPVDKGVLVERVEPGSPAAKAGLEGGTTEVVVAGEGYRLGGDLIVAADGKRVTTIAAAARRARGAPAGRHDRARDLHADGEKQTVRVKLGRLPSRRPALESDGGRPPARPRTAEARRPLASAGRRREPAAVAFRLLAAPRERFVGRS